MNAWSVSSQARLPIDLMLSSPDDRRLALGKYLSELIVESLECLIHRAAADMRTSVRFIFVRVFTPIFTSNLKILILLRFRIGFTRLGKYCSKLVYKLCNIIHKPLCLLNQNRISIISSELTFAMFRPACFPCIQFLSLRSFFRKVFAEYLILLFASIFVSLFAPFYYLAYQNQ